MELRPLTAAKKTALSIIVVGATGLAVSVFFIGVKTWAQTADQRPAFEKQTITIDGKPLTVEIADSDDRRAFGLMFVQQMPENEGMLFVFPDEARRSFWMKNTLIPLSIAYFGRDKVLKKIIDMQPAVLGEISPTGYPSGVRSMYALEVNQGWFSRMKIRPGARLKFADKDSDKSRTRKEK